MLQLFSSRVQWYLCRCRAQNAKQRCFRYIPANNFPENVRNSIGISDLCKSHQSNVHHPIRMQCLLVEHERNRFYKFYGKYYLGAANRSLASLFIGKCKSLERIYKHHKVILRITNRIYCLTAHVFAVCFSSITSGKREITSHINIVLFIALHRDDTEKNV